MDDTGEAPFFSICIPQYNRVKYLQMALQSVKSQDFTDYEVIVSDDCSTDETATLIPALLKELFPRSSYIRTPRNLGYDGNLRSAISAARGRYVFFLGNDDEIGDPALLGDAAAILRADSSIGVIIGNYRSWATKEAIVVNFTESRNLGSGPLLACNYFRQFVNVSGQILDRELCHRFATDRWDGPAWYQIFLACRILASGRTLYAWSRFTSNRDIEIGGEISSGQWRKERTEKVPLKVESFRGDSLCRVTLAGVADYCSREQCLECGYIVTRQLMSLTYPYWLTMYRRYRSFTGAIGIAMGMWPRRFLKDVSLRVVDRPKIWLYYAAATVFGLFIPLRLLEFAIKKHNTAGHGQGR